MKKALSLLTALLMAVVFSFPVFAAESADSVQVYVTISDGEGKLVMAQEPVTVTDRDNDGKFTVDEALYAAHEAKYTGGAAEGYGTENTAYGLSLAKLWGVANGGSYGYYVNNGSAMGLTQEVNEGDRINAYAYTDLTTWSDKYCYFDKHSVSGKAGDTVTLTLLASDYDENFSPVTVAVEGAVIYIDGKATEYKTDAEGKVTLTLSESDKYVISAASDTMTLVPPVCIADVEVVADTTAAVESDDTQSEAVTSTGCGGYVSITGIAVTGLAAAFVFRRRNEE